MLRKAEGGRICTAGWLGLEFTLRFFFLQHNPAKEVILCCSVHSSVIDRALNLCLALGLAHENMGTTFYDEGRKDNFTKEAQIKCQEVRQNERSRGRERWHLRDSLQRVALAG